MRGYSVRNAARNTAGDNFRVPWFLLRRLLGEPSFRVMETDGLMAFANPLFCEICHANHDKIALLYRTAANLYATTRASASTSTTSDS